MNADSKWSRFIPREEGYYWARLLGHNGPGTPFVVYAYHFRRAKSERMVFNMRTVDSIVVSEGDVKDRYEVSCEPITCPISTSKPSRRPIDLEGQWGTRE